VAADGAKDNLFGNSVAISGNIAVIGATNDSHQTFNAGSAYIFDVTTGQQLYKLLANDGAMGDWFGQSVAISGNTAVIGASGDNDNGADSGSAYFFDVTTGKQLFKLLAPDGIVQDYFGESVAISGTIAAIGAPYDDDNGANSGSVYIFDAVTGKQLTKIIPADGTSENQFGGSVAVGGSIVMIGAANDDDLGIGSGSAYSFQQRTTNLLLVSPMPLIAKQRGTFSIVNALVNERTWLLYSIDGLEPTFIQQLNVVVDLANPQIAVAPRLTDTNGDLQFNLPMPDMQHSLNVWFQAVQQRNVTTSEATQIVR